MRVVEHLVERLKQLDVWYMTPNQRQISIRCPFCGDSRNANSAHMYIKIDVSDYELPPYYCHKCHAKGVVSDTLLRKLDAYDSELAKNMATIKNRKSTPRVKRVGEKLDLILPRIEETPRSLMKLNYINQRLGLNLTLEDMTTHKIVFSLYDLLDINHITKLTCRLDMGDTLDANFIGFLSGDNHYLVMRNLSKKKLANIRYYNYNLMDYGDAKKYYVYPTKVDLMLPKVDMVLCEGIFDLLGIIHHFEENRENTIFVAVCGSGYQSVIEDFIRLGFLGLNIRIYADSDVRLSDLKKMKRNIPVLADEKISVFFNAIGKDYGVRKNEIELNRFEI